MFQYPKKLFSYFCLPDLVNELTYSLVQKVASKWVVEF